MKKIILLGCLVSLLLLGCWTGLSNQISETHYDATKHIFLAEVLPPPPVKGSIEDKQDLAAVLKAEAHRTPSEIHESKLDAYLSVFRFQPALGPKFTPQNLPITTAFFVRIRDDECQVIEAAKSFYDRPRPYIADPQIKTLVPKPHNTSYPSGHASLAYVSAILLAKMLPEKETQIFDRAEDFANNRIIAGVHYPTDVMAGKIAASVITHELLQDPEFLADFEQSKKEVRAVLLNEPNNAENKSGQ